MKDKHPSLGLIRVQDGASSRPPSVRYGIAVLCVPLLLTFGVEQSRAATCAFDGTTIASATKLSTSCAIDQAVTIGAPHGILAYGPNVTLSVIGSLTNNGQIINGGSILNTGSLIDGGLISGKGALNNIGKLTVDAGGNVQIGASQNLSRGTLTGGTWIIQGASQQAAVLTLGSGNITTNDANVQLIGPAASFAQLNGLNLNNGSFAVGGQSVSFQSLRNTGTVSALSGGGIVIRNSANFSNATSNATLTGGTWIVDSRGGQSASLVVGNGKLNTNDATIELYGSKSTFLGLNTLANNAGTLIVGSGANFALGSAGSMVAMNNSGTLSTLSGGVMSIGNRQAVIDSGVVSNGGQLYVSGELSGSGSLNNSGAITIGPGGIVHVANSGNVSAGTLTGGNWLLNSNGAAAATLALGGAPISTNDANVTLNGANTNFSQLSSMTRNLGSLAIANRSYSISSLDNAGAIDVLAGGSVSISHSSNLSHGVLSGGTWVVAGTGGQSASLTIGGGDIQTNAATVVLQGGGAQFAQLQGHLNKNLGTLELQQSATFNENALVNDGTVQVSSGASLNVHSGSVSAGTLLSGGTWVISGGTYLKPTTVSLGGGPITNNDATLELQGENINFSQLLTSQYATQTRPPQTLGLTKNGGSLLLGQIAVADTTLTNSGTVTLDSGAIMAGGNYSSTSAKSRTVLAGGYLIENNVSLSKGSLSGNGLVRAHLIDVAQGASIEATGGLLSLTSQLQLDGSLVFDISGVNNYGVIGLNDLQSNPLEFGSNAFMQFNFSPSFALVDSSYSFQFLTSNYSNYSNFRNFRFSDMGGNLAYYSARVSKSPLQFGSVWTLTLSRKDVLSSAAEPGSLALAMAGLLGLLPALRRRRKRLQ